MKIGFIGTGTMGQPMLANLVKKGFQVVAYDVVPAALDAAVALGAARAARSREAAADGDLVITMLPSSGNVEAAYLGAGGIIESAAPGGSASTCRRSIPAPRSASRRGSRSAGSGFSMRRCRAGSAAPPPGHWRSWSAARPSDLEEARPALAAMGANIIHVGAVGAGEVAKLCNNLISGSALIAVAEAFRIGEAFGVDPQILTNVIAKSSGATWVMEHMHPVPGIVDSAASSRQYAPGFMTDLMAKDLGLAVSAAREKRVPVVVAPAAQQLYRHGLIARPRPRGFLRRSTNS